MQHSIKISIFHPYLLGLLILTMSGFSSKNVNAQSTIIEATGDVLLFAMPATALTSSLVIKDYEGTWQFAKGFAMNQVISIGLKHAINKRRPFNNGDYAFPSGHTSTAFQSAAFIQKRYGWHYGIPAYALAGFTGFSRINAKRHDGWDVLAGALVGIGSAYLFTTPYQQEHFELSFKSGDGDYLIGIIYKY
jgi:membrane-associated phospholipid phosphatase